MDWMTLPLKRYFEFSCRSRRREFWMFTLFTVIVQVIGACIDLALGYGQTDTYSTGTGWSYTVDTSGPVQAIAALALLIPTLSVSFRRLHDTNRSAWWLLIGLVPIAGWIVLIVFYCEAGTAGANRFGPDPIAAAPDA